MRPFLLISGDFVKTGGMDRANHALATYLANSKVETHIVAHRVDSELLEMDNLVFHRVPKPFDSYMAGEPLLDRAGRWWANRLRDRGVRVVVNGSNCQWGDVNWVHYLHAAYADGGGATMLLRQKNKLYRQLSKQKERRVIRSARTIVANSQRTKADLVENLNIDEKRIRPIYYGVDPNLFRPVGAEERGKIRRELNWSGDRTIVLFIGGLGDERKGFDTLFRAWTRLGQGPGANSELMVVGVGAEIPLWKKRAESAGIDSIIHFLGRRGDVAQLLSAADALVAPSRYEAYGLAVHEALCSGLPAFVTKTAGVAERYPPSLQPLLLDDPDDDAELANRIRLWRSDSDYYRSQIRQLGDQLRRYTWRDMAADFVGCLTN
ncbi:MAG: glycosyltransferase family 4 protein [Candidatus Binatus sp.]